MSNKCPKCGKKLSPFYLKQNCPYCNVDLLYYQLDERLEADAKESARQEAKIKHFTDTVKSSSVSSFLHILRLILFFTPLASMCLPMYRAGHKTVSLIGFILSIVNHGFDAGAWSNDYLFAVLAIIFVIVLSLAVIIDSLFSVTKHGTERNFIFSLVNTAVFGLLSLLVCLNGGAVRIGFYLTLSIYLFEFILHYLISEKKPKILLAISVILFLVITVCCFAASTEQKTEYPDISDKSALTVVSFNTAAPWGFGFDDTSSEVRVERFIKYMNSVSPSLIGTQELNSAWLETLNERMPEYESYAVKRGGDENETKSEMNGIFWKKDMFDVVETNTFWLSETPEKESRFTYTDEDGKEREAGCNRICSYAVLTLKSSGEKIAFLNTHLDNSSEEAINFGANLICDKINEIREKYDGIHIILSGDFNQTDDGIAYRTISAVLNDTTDKSLKKATWQEWGYSDTGDKPIDFIFTSDGSNNYQVLDTLDPGYVSDHYGIMTDVILQ